MSVSYEFRDKAQIQLKIDRLRMAYIVPHDLDGFMPHLRKLDTKFRIQLGNDLLTYLSNPDRSIQTQDIGLLVDHILQWTQSSNFKVRIC